MAKKKAGVTHNLTDVEESDGGYDPIPRGTYPMVVDETTYQESKAGNPMLVIRLEISDGEYEGRKLWDRVTLSEKALSIFKKRLRIYMEANDLNKEFKALMKSVGPDELQELADGAELVGAEVNVQVGVRTYEGEARNEVKRVSEAEDLEEGDEDFMEDDDDDDDDDEDEVEEKPAKKGKKGKKK